MLDEKTDLLLAVSIALNRACYLLQSSMRITLLLVLFQSFLSFSQELTSHPELSPSASAPKVNYEIIEICGCGRETHYAGGIRALQADIKNHLSFPSDFQWRDLKMLRAYVKFVIELDGSITGLEVIRTNFPDANEYILDAFQYMPNWIPGEENCLAEQAYVRVPITIWLK